MNKKTAGQIRLFISSYDMFDQYYLEKIHKNEKREKTIKLINDNEEVHQSGQVHRNRRTCPLCYKKHNGFIYMSFSNSSTGIGL